MKLRLPLLIAILVLALSPSGESGGSTYPVDPVTAKAVGDKFGIDFVNGPGYDVSEKRYQQALDAGAKWTRWPMYWQDIETSPGKLDDEAYKDQDKVVAQDVAHGLRISAVLVGTPAWAATAGTSSVPMPRIQRKTFDGLKALGLGVPSAITPPSDLYSPALRDGTVNMQNPWARFVYTTVRRYKDRIKTWELWNEPDLKMKDGPVFWAGSAKDYYQLLKVGYQAAKAADPTATVLFSGLAYWSDPEFFTRVLAVAKTDPTAPANGYYFDVLPLHFYVSPYHLYNYPVKYRAQMLANLGTAKPIWVNETNIPLCGDAAVDSAWSCPIQWFGNMEEQASFVVQAFALAAAGGVERVFIFQLYDDAVGEHDWYGLVRNDGTPRPAFTAYKAAAKYFSGATSAVLASSGRVEKVVLYGPADTKTTVFWNNSGVRTPASIVLAGTSRTLYNKYGAQQAISVQRGVLSVSLPPATYLDPVYKSYDVGGDPFILVEKGIFQQRLYLPGIGKGAP